MNIDIIHSIQYITLTLDLVVLSTKHVERPYVYLHYYNNV